MCSQWQAKGEGELLGLWFVKVSAEFSQPESYSGEWRHWCRPEAKALMQRLVPPKWLS